MKVGNRKQISRLNMRMNLVMGRVKEGKENKNDYDVKCVCTNSPR